MNSVVRKILELSSITGRQLSDEAVVSFSNQLLKKLSPTEAYLAIDQWLERATTNQFPMPAQLISMVLPDPLDERKEAALVTRKLEQAILRKKDSWTDGVYQDGQPTYAGGNKVFFSWPEAAREELGGVGFEVVKLMRWRNLCDMYYSMDSGQFYAQIRDTVEAILLKSKRGELHEKLELPKPKILSLISELSEQKMLGYPRHERYS